MSTENRTASSLAWASDRLTAATASAAPGVRRRAKGGTGHHHGAVAAGPRFLNSYDINDELARARMVAAGPRFLNSYDGLMGADGQHYVAAGPRFLNSYDVAGTVNDRWTLRLDPGF